MLGAAAESEGVVQVEAAVDGPGVEPDGIDALRICAPEEDVHDLRVRRDIATRPDERRRACHVR